jgi:hypothetical protein
MPTPNEQLKACPFCGMNDSQGFIRGDPNTLECKICGASGPCPDFTENSSINWNHRPIEAELERKLAVAVKALERLATYKGQLDPAVAKQALAEITDSGEG